LKKKIKLIEEALNLFKGAGFTVPPLSFPPLKEYFEMELPFEQQTQFLKIVINHLTRTDEIYFEYPLEDIFSIICAKSNSKFDTNMMEFLFEYYKAKEIFRFVLLDLVIKNNSISFRHAPEELNIENDSNNKQSIESVKIYRDACMKLGPQYVIPLLIYNPTLSIIDLSNYFSSMNKLEWIDALPDKVKAVIKIKGLILTKCNIINDSEFKYIKRLHKLEYINLDYLKISSGMIQELESLTNLKKLSLNNTEIKSDLLLRIKDYLRDIEELSLCNCSSASEGTILLLKRKYPNLILNLV